MRACVVRALWPALVAALGASRLSAQTGTGTIAGTVNDANHRPLSGAIVQVIELRLGAYTDNDGAYRIERVPVGQVRVVARIPGFVSDTESLTVAADKITARDFALKPTSVTLQTVQISSPRLNETKAAALNEQKTADNIVSVLSGDEIRSLPNANAAEAAARMPGVTSERDEGEGKFVEIRGTPPWFQNVEIDGVHVPGTLNGDRSVKLDDVPSDLLGAIEVSKTLNADQDADAIGGTVNLLSKIPEGSPRGYISGQYSYQTLQTNSQGQGSLTYGGRLGDQNKFGFLLGGSYDRTNRVIADVEPSYGVDNVNTATGLVNPIPNGSAARTDASNTPVNFNHYYPSSWSERPYNYYRTRYGVNGDLDYRFSPTSVVYARGLWSAFFDEANRWITGVNGGTDQLVNGVPTVTGASISPFYSNRGPIEHTWGGVLGAKNVVGQVHFDYSVNYSGSSATEHDHLDDSYNPSPLLSNFNYTYNQNRLVPTYNVDPAIRAAIANGNSYTLGSVNSDNESTDGQDFGAQINALLPYSIGNLPATTKIGAKYTNEHKGYTNNTVQYAYNGANTLSQYPESYTWSNFYSRICPGCYTLAPFASIPGVQQTFHSSPQAFAADPTALYNDLQGTFAGTEQVLAAYVMQILDVGDMHVNVGLRAENTEIGYAAYSAGINDTVASQLHVVHQGHSYTDLFPSLNLKYALDENTNVRAALTRGIARPNYSDLAPSFNGAGAQPGSFSSGVSTGNPALKPEYSWNYDLLGEHYFPSVGVLSGGFFYKDIHDFIFSRRYIYAGPNPQFTPTGSCQANLAANNCFYATQPQNGPSAHEWGFEMDYTQHLTFLPGAFKGIGFDVNWTHVESQARVPVDTTISYTYAVTATDTETVHPYHGAFRRAPLERQFPNLFNVALLYDYGPVSIRMSGQYTGSSIYFYGQDGSSNPNSGDNWNFPHWQIDGSAVWTVYKATAIQGQVLNLNNAVFGFFNGNGLPGSGHGFNTQREYYGTTFFIGIRQGI